MTYTERLISEFKYLSDKTTEGRLRRKSVSVRMAKIRRLVSMARNEHIPKAKWLAKLFSGRPNRTPFKFKFQRY